MRGVIVLFITLLISAAAEAESCPPSQTENAPEISTLHGKLNRFGELRNWLGIELDQPACGEKIVQLVFKSGDRNREVEALRGCEVTASGKLYEPVTGYYSAKLAIFDPDVKADASCHPQPVEPDPSKADIPADLRSYRASIVVDFRGKGRTKARAWRGQDEQNALRPTTAFVTYMLNGSGEVLHFNCRDGFAVKTIRQMPKGDAPVDEGYFETTDLKDLNGVNKIEFSCEKKSEK